ncbi:MAG: NAD(P)-binding domain-containing protein [Catenulispora sp.]|nr:NAD(P)-binding domain-containing protein [Catenulispora sp.]
MTTQPTSVSRHRFAILGAGPAGVQLASYLRAAGADYVILERADGPASFFRRFPRHRKLISLNKLNVGTDDREIQLRWDWNSLLSAEDKPVFADYSRDWFPDADTLVQYVTDFQKTHVPDVRFGVDVVRVSRTDDGFRLLTADGEVVEAECLIAATGWGGPNIPAIEGIEHAVGYEDASTDPAQYRDKRVLVIGKGNSAFETALPMLGHARVVHLASPNPVRLAWHSKHPGDVRGQFGALLDGYWFKTLDAVLECQVDRIRPHENGFRVDITYTLAGGEQTSLDYDTVICCTGFRMDTSIFDDSCRVDLMPNGRIPASGPDWQSPSVDGLYFAGTIAQARDTKHASSPFIDGFRYNLRALTELLLERYENRPLPRERVRTADLTSTILDRLNGSSAVGTQFEYLVDAFVLDGDEAWHYRELPEDLLIERFADADRMIVASLRWGDRTANPDVFAIERRPTPEHADESAFIHPVIRRYERGRLVDECHLLEDLHGVWRRPDRHVEPLQRYLDKIL